MLRMHAGVPPALHAHLSQHLGRVMNAVRVKDVVIVVPRHLMLTLLLFVFITAKVGGRVHVQGEAV